MMRVCSFLPLWARPPKPEVPKSEFDCTKKAARLKPEEWEALNLECILHSPHIGPHEPRGAHRTPTPPTGKWAA